jgi:hypothetical protein
MSYPVGTVIEVSNDGNNSELMIRVKLFEDSSQSTDVLVLFPGNKAKFINSLALQIQQAKVIEKQNLAKQLAETKLAEEGIQGEEKRSEEKKSQISQVKTTQINKKPQDNLDNLLQINLQPTSLGLSTQTKNIPKSHEKKKEKSQTPSENSSQSLSQNSGQSIKQVKTTTSPQNSVVNSIKPDSTKIISKPVPKPKSVTAKVEEKTSLEENLSIDSLD